MVGTDDAQRPLVTGGCSATAAAWGSTGPTGVKTGLGRDGPLPVAGQAGERPDHGVEHGRPGHERHGTHVRRAVALESGLSMAVVGRRDRGRAEGAKGRPGVRGGLAMGQYGVGRSRRPGRLAATPGGGHSTADGPRRRAGLHGERAASLRLAMDAGRALPGKALSNRAPPAGRRGRTWIGAAAAQRASDTLEQAAEHLHGDGVMTAIEQRRTAALGGHVEQCDHCGHRRVWYNSCRNRHCPTLNRPASTETARRAGDRSRAS